MKVHSGSVLPVGAERRRAKETAAHNLLIRGGKRLSGEIVISGAKNAVLKLMAAALLTKEPCVIRNVPVIGDVFNMIEVLEGLGARCALDGDVLAVEAKELIPVAPEGPVREMRASVQVMGPLLARLGEVRIAQPGGCAIGDRPVDLHLAGLTAMGAEIEERHGFIHAKAGRLRGAEIHFDIPSVGATENIMMAAALAEGETVIRNAAREPEIIEVQNFINCLGGRVRGAGTDTIRITGVGGPLKGADYTVIPDRIEAGTMMVAVAAAGGDVVLRNVIVEHNELLVAKLAEAGVLTYVDGEDVRVVSAAGSLKPLQIRTQPYPGYPTDMQPQIMALLTQADGTSIVTETVYSSRFKHVDELRRMGADITVEGRVAVVRGPRALTGARVEASDLRAGAALVIAALAAEGDTVIEGVRHIDRGYENLAGKLRGVDADVSLVPAGEAYALHAELVPDGRA